MTAPLGSIALAQEYLRTTLADCTSFRTWVGAVNQAQALARIHHEALPPPITGSEHTLEELRAYRPCALIWTDVDNGFARRVVSVDSSIDSGSLGLRLAQDVGEEISHLHAEVYQRFINSVGQIVDELVGLAGLAGYLAMTSLELKSGPFRSHPDEYETVGDIQFCDLRITWGATG